MKALDGKADNPVLLGSEAVVSRVTNISKR
jgi:hypothetical protein